MRRGWLLAILALLASGAVVLVLATGGQVGEHPEERHRRPEPEPEPEPEPARVAGTITARGNFPAAPPERSEVTEPEPEVGSLVDVADLAPGVRLDMRYASERNFTGVAVYSAARCLLRVEVARALAAVQEALEADGLGLLVWDCYRPFSVQKRFWELVPDPRYVARPVERDGRPVSGSKHNRGAAVDLTLVTAAGEPVEMPTDHDDFSRRAHRGHAGWSREARANSERLERAMIEQGFQPLPTEWWHFDGPGWRRYPLEDVPLSPL